MSTPLPQQILRGVTLVVIAAFVISVNDVVFKTFAGHLSLWQVFALRGVLAVPILALIGFRQVRQFAQGFAPWPLLRAVTFTFTLLAFYAALPYLSFATVGAANYTAPLFVAIIAALVVGERVSPLGWVGLILGFVGILVLLQPGTDAFSPWVLLPILGAVAYAVSHTITRLKCQHLSPLTLSFAQNTTMMISGFLVGGLFLTFDPSAELLADHPALFRAWPTLDLRDWGILLALALITILASTLIAAAYQSAPAPTVATFEYSYLIFAAGWDSFFGDLPTRLALLGIGLIVIAGVLVLRTTNPSSGSKTSSPPAQVFE